MALGPTIRIEVYCVGAPSTPGVTPTRTLTPTVTASPTLTSTVTRTSTSTVTPTHSPSPTASVSATPTITPTRTVTPTNSATSGASPTPTSSVSPTNSITPTRTVTATPSITPTWSVTPTRTVTNTVTPTNSVSPTNSVTPTHSVSPTQSITLSNSPNTCNVYLLTAKGASQGAPQTVNFVGCGGVSQSVVVSTNDSGPTVICCLPAPTTPNAGMVDIVYQGPCLSGTPTPSPSKPPTATLTIDYTGGKFTFSLTNPLTVNLSFSGNGQLQVAGFATATDCGSSQSFGQEGDALTNAVTLSTGSVYTEQISGGLSCSSVYKRMLGSVTINGVSYSDGNTFTAGGTTITISLFGYLGCVPYSC